MTGSANWHLLCDHDEIPDDTSKEFTIAGLPLFAVKKNGQIYTYKNRCPHLGIALNWQEDLFLDSEKALIQCATHGALFLIKNGRCVAGPCNGQSLMTLENELRDGKIYVCIALNKQKVDVPTVSANK